MIQLFKKNFNLVILCGYIGVSIIFPKHYLILSTFNGFEFGKRRKLKCFWKENFTPLPLPFPKN